MINPVINRVPYASSIISNCKNSVWDYSNLICTYNFVLILNEYVYSVKNISGIDRDYPNDPASEGGNEWPIFIKNYNNSSFIKISLERAMPIRKSKIAMSLVRSGLSAAAMKCYEGIAQNVAKKAALISTAALDPIITLENGPALGIIQVFDKTFTRDVANFKFFSYGAERWSTTALDGMSADIVYENIDLVCSDLTRMTSDWSKGPSGIWNKDSDGSMYDEKEMKKLEEFRKKFINKQEEIRKLYKKEDSFIDKQIKNLENSYQLLEKELKKKDEKFDEQKKIKEQKRKENEEKLKREVEELNKKKDENVKQAEEKKKKYEEMKSNLLKEEKEKQEKEKKENEEAKKMKERAAEEVKKEIDRKKKKKKWKDNQKT